MYREYFKSMKLFNIYKKIRQRYKTGTLLLNNSYHKNTKNKTEEEIQKKPSRTEIINYLITSFNKLNTLYLEIGVRDPTDNFNKIQSNSKYSVDPGVEFKENPVDFKMTSDVFFDKLRKCEILKPNIKFDIIFIDGLHLAEQVERDILNSLDFIQEKGFIIVHDCNPPSEFHARESYNYWLSPAEDFWNGTTWKAFFKFRQRNDINSCCINSDWGVGIISKNIYLGKSSKTQNKFYEYSILNDNREESLNLIEFSQFKEKISL